jgi:hypothetical protein
VNKTQIASLVLGSAAIGALTSSIIAFVGQAIERRSRVKELLLSKAIDMARDRINFLTEAAKQSEQAMIVESHLVYAGDLYQDLVYLFKKGSLPPKVHEAVDAYRKKFGE